jgi:hypothetical protein
MFVHLSIYLWEVHPSNDGLSLSRERSIDCDVQYSVASRLGSGKMENGSDSESCILSSDFRPDNPDEDLALRHSELNILP